MHLITQLKNTIPCGHLKPFFRWVQSGSVIEKKLILGMIGKGKVLFHFCKETPGREMARLILDSRGAFTYTPHIFTYKVPKVN
jgi:hypothetical protein